MVEVAGYERNVNVSALPYRFAIVDRFEHRESARMSLNGSSHGVQIPSSRMRCERLPLRKSISRSLDSCIHIGSRSLGYGCDLLSRGGIGRIEKYAFDRLSPSAIDEVAEVSLMAVEPEQRILRVLRRGSVIHGEEFLSYAHSSRFAFFLAR